VLAAGRPGRERASPLQYPGLRIGQLPLRNQSGGTSPLDRGQQELGGNRLDPIATQVPVASDRVVHVPRHPLAGASQRGQHPTEPVTADAKLGLDRSLDQATHAERFRTAASPPWGALEPALRQIADVGWDTAAPCPQSTSKTVP
jgi:hypothetical protein